MDSLGWFYEFIIDILKLVNEKFADLINGVVEILKSLINFTTTFIYILPNDIQNILFNFLTFFTVILVVKILVFVKKAVF